MCQTLPTKISEHELGDREQVLRTCVQMTLLECVLCRERASLTSNVACRLIYKA